MQHNSDESKSVPGWHVLIVLRAAEALTKVAGEHPSVTIGSYPRTEQSQAYGVKLTLQSRDQAALEAASKAVLEKIKAYE